MGKDDPVVRAYPVSRRHILVFVERTPYGSLCKKLTLAAARRFARKAIEAATILKQAIGKAETASKRKG